MDKLKLIYEKVKYFLNNIGGSRSFLLGVIIALGLSAFSCSVFATESHETHQPNIQVHDDKTKDRLVGFLLGAAVVGLVWNYDKKKSDPPIEVGVKLREQK